MRLKSLLLFLGWVLMASSLFAQAPSVFGTLQDSLGKPIAGAGVTLTPTAEGRPQGVFSDNQGSFRFERVRPGDYSLAISAPGFNDISQSITVPRGPLDLGSLQLSTRSYQLDAVQIEGQEAQAQQKGDTTQYNASAFKTNPDATAQDLIEKMPGITRTNGQVNAQGERVQQVLVDGKPFFGTDPNAALKNLPAEVISKIEVFDQQSEQSQQTGVDDGQTTKTINIVTKPETRNGKFGRVYGGYGYEDRYQAGASLNFFNDARRISVLGLSNNINIQNFSSEDLLGVVSTNSRGRRRGPPRNPAGEFLVSQQGGITNTHAFGLNYSDNWGKKIEVAGNYFANLGDNVTGQFIDRVYFVEGDSGQVYREASTSESRNINHRFNMRLQYKPTERITIVYRPRFTLQQNRGEELFDGTNSLDSTLLNQTQTNYGSDLVAWNMRQRITATRRFAKRGRSISINLDAQFSQSMGDNTLVSTQQFFRETLATDSLQQQTTLNSNGTEFEAEVRYTEPLGKIGTLRLGYEYGPEFNDTDTRTLAFNPATGTYSLLDTLLSNTFASRYNAHQAGAGFFIRKGRELFVIGRVNYQYATLANDQLFPQEFTVNQGFHNLLPFFLLRYKTSEQQNLRVIYRGGTTIPTGTQLQQVVNNSNPFQLTTGNPDLQQAFDHRLIIRYGGTNTQTSRVFYFLVNANLTENYIGTNTLIASRDTLLDGGVFLPRGVQISAPENLSGFLSANTFITYGFPLTPIKSNMNFNLSGSYQRRPGIINEVKNITDTYSSGLGVTISSNISENVDFTISSQTDYNWAFNALQPALNTTFLSQTTRLRLNLIFWKGMVFRSNVSHSYFDGLSEAVTPNFWLWNASIAKKFLKNNRGELALSVFDALGQNISVARNATDLYIEDVQTQVLQRYFMLTFTYNLRQFEASTEGQGGPPPYGRPGGPGGPPRRN